MKAPVVTLNERGSRELAAMRWGFPPPSGSNRPVVNVRNTASSYWRNWLNSEYRCLVPATDFCEWTDSSPKRQYWFGLTEDRPQLFCFAGIWRPWTGTRKDETGEHRLFAILTTAPNELIQPIHSRAMPVILDDEDAWDIWLTGSTEEALLLQRPLPSGRLRIIA
jgi:putative SOS response-associated peptidase YedK